MSDNVLSGSIALNVFLYSSIPVIDLLNPSKFVDLTNK